MVELIWDGKYDKDGRRAAPLRMALPFQTVETVNESAQQRQKMLDLFSAGRDPEWRNRLIWGDKKYVLPSLLPEFAGKVDLIYIDPPFATGADFTFQANVGEEQFTKQQSMIEEKAYRDTWGRGLDGYIEWFYEAAVFLNELLAPHGSIYVHLDWHVGHYAKVVLDEVFGKNNFISEIIREKANPKNYTKVGFGNIHDVIFFYGKSQSVVWNKTFLGRSEVQINKDFPLSDAEGRRYNTVPIHAPGVRRGETGNPWRGLMPPPGRHWAYVHATLDALDAEGHIEWSSTGNPREKIYADESSGLALQDLWLGMKDVKGEYPSMKNPDILERIIGASSNEGDLVLDCFCGSGTTATVAEKLGRRWITCDLGRFAIHTARKRLLAVPDVRPFIVQNLGKYERQVWQRAEFGENAAALQREYRRFILDLYHADALDGFAWLHGLKAGRYVHVGAVDSPVTRADVQQAIAELRRARGSGATAAAVDMLGWDFALDTNETVRQEAEASGVSVRLLIIPREVLEKKAVEQGDIRFFELAALGVDTRITGREVAVKLTDFMVPQVDVPQDVQAAVKQWSDWIDYWAVDWNYRDDTFHNEWQSYRTRKDRALQLQAQHAYEEPGEYTILVKVIDVLGNDTTKAVRVRVG
jgi:adenine-specific DNA-methyltransferase